MDSLIDTQTNLLRHLTSHAFIFGTRDLDAAAHDPHLRGMDIRRLRLEAEFSYNKRMKRIRQTFERTATLLGHGFEKLLRDFAATSPPTTYERYPDAKCFHDHFLERSAQEPPTPAWAADVAAIELALAEARTLRPTAMESEALAVRPQPSPDLWYRAHPCAVPVRCRYDVRCLFEPGRSGEPIPQRPVCLVVLAARGRRQPLVLEVAPETLARLERSKQWSPLASNGAGTDDNARVSLIKRLAAQGLVLVDGNDSLDENRG